MSERQDNPDGQTNGINIPFALLGVSTILWGSQQFLLPFALIIAAVVELSRHAPFAWDFSDQDFHRLADITGIGLLLVVVVQFSDHGLSGIYGVLRWFPVVLLGLVLGQCYSTRNAIKLSALFLSVRLGLIRGRIKNPGELDMRIPFLVACLLSASAGPERNVWVIPVAAAIIIWLLLANRPTVRSRSAVAVSLGACVVIALLAQQGVTEARRAIEPFVMELVRERLRYLRDPFRQQTAIGDIGQLKTSNRIVLRVEAPKGTEPPTLLREASYTHFNNNTWFARDRNFTDLESKAVGTRWDLAQARQAFKLTTVSRSLYRNRGILALPNGSFRVDDLPVEEVKRNRTGAVKVLNGPNLIRYQVRYNENYNADSPPGEDDTFVPERLQQGLRTWLREAKLEGAPTRQILQTLKNTFSNDFRYSLRLTGRGLLSDPIMDFLNLNKRGHCEYFATSTVLLLRAAGIPARYASGFLVQEYSPLEERYLVRRRHAHSWAQVWWQGRWLDFDTTPAIWFGEEEAQAPWWQSSYDLISMLFHSWSLWRLEGSEESDNSQLVWFLPPLIVYILWRVAKSRRVRRQLKDESAEIQTHESPTVDSNFVLIEQSLARNGFQRPLGMPGKLWLQSLMVTEPPPGLEVIFENILPLYNRHRFHPQGLSPGQRQDLTQRIGNWLQEFGEIK